MPLFNGEDPERGIIYVDNATGPCGQCKAVTHYADIDFQCWVCSTECQDKLWAGFCEAAFGPGKNKPLIVS